MGGTGHVDDKLVIDLPETFLRNSRFSQLVSKHVEDSIAASCTHRSEVVGAGGAQAAEGHVVASKGVITQVTRLQAAYRMMLCDHASFLKIDDACTDVVHGVAI